MEQTTKFENIVVKAKSLNNCGILDDKDNWWNFPKGVNPSEELKKLLTELNKGDKITLVLSNANPRNYVSFSITEKATVRSGGFDNKKDIVSVNDLLKKAHEKWPTMQIITEWLNPGNLDCPVFKATLTIFDKEKLPGIFTAHGEATNENTEVKDALLRMAETRAISRALRFALGEEVTDVEVSGSKNNLEKAYDELKENLASIENI